MISFTTLMSKQVRSCFYTICDVDKSKKHLNIN